MAGLETSLSHVDDMYGNWFLDYASYVILERAVPHINDGLKPVQRRILHVLKSMDDGRLHKVANVAGRATAFHPHGNVAIEDALIQLGQKGLLVDTQGNWGDPLTGDPPAAARYIECKLSAFALEVGFSPKITEWQASYDGRNKEPVTLPVKFPLVLAQGIEGIAVGLACKILSHNFIELIEASIDTLRGKKVNVLPDFFSGGLMDATEYNEGLRGGKIRVRARIEKAKRNLLIIREIPYGTTTVGLKSSILAANDKGKIKISKVDDLTAENVEIQVTLPSGTDADQAIQGLFAFSDCEVSISPNSCVIDDNKPRFLSVNDLIKASAFHTKELLRQELEIRLGELEEKWHFASLEKIFIEKRIYRDIEESETWKAVIKAIDKGLKPHVKKLRRIVTEEDIVRLTEIKIKRISKYNKFKANEQLKALEDEIAQVNKHLKQLTRYAVAWFKNLQKKYSKGRERRTEITTFSKVQASKVVIANEKLFLNKSDGFVGTTLKKDDLVGPCSSLNDFIVFRSDGTMTVSRVAAKVFVGKDPQHVAIYRKDTPVFYTMIYRDGRGGACYAKKFTVSGVTRDKIYDLTRGKSSSRLLWFGVHKTEDDTDFVVRAHFKAEGLRLRNLSTDFDFGSLETKARGVVGLQVTKKPVQRIAKPQGS
ncbi:MAG: DNA gyrase/topoisomerase IV subunit A [Verrucomicrobiaceae bacterium]|nr:DNA gyrase/topoisomerase IV subunit A [Verrucomicrobiaceae bacterium]